MELLRLQFNWDGNQWKIVRAKRHPNLGRKSASGRRRIACVEESFSDGEYNSPDPESSAAKRSRKEPEQPDVILYKCSEDASVIGTDSNLSASRKLPGGLSTPPCKLMPNAGEVPVNHQTLSGLVLPEKKEGQTHHVQPLHEKSDVSDNAQTRLKGNNDFSSKEINCALNASTKCPKTRVLTRQVSPGTNSGSNIKVYLSKRSAIRKVLKVRHSPQRSMDATSTVQQRGENKVAGSTVSSSFVLEGTKSQTQQQHESPLEDTSNIT